MFENVNRQTDGELKKIGVGEGLGVGESGWGIRVDVNEELKFLGKIHKKREWGVRWGVRSVGGGTGWM